MLTVILGLAIACVTVAIGWVCWTCIDSLQNKAGNLKNFNVTAENTKINSQHLEMIKNDLDSKVSMADLAPSEDLQAVLVKQSGSEILYSNATRALDNKQYPLALGLYTKILDMIPAEAEKKSTWYASGATVERTRYTMWVHRQRSLCYRHLKNYPRALEEISKAIKLLPNISANYRIRSEIYNLLGQKALADADLVTMQRWQKHYSGAHEGSSATPFDEIKLER